MVWMVITTSPLVKTYSLQEFWDLPEPADHAKLELIKGVLYLTPPPDELHNEVSSDLHEVLLTAIRKNKYSRKLYTPRAALWIDENTYLEPDLMYISAELKADMGTRLSRADIVIEILSPSTALYDRTTMSDTYRAMGVREMWLVDTRSHEIEVRSFEAGETAVYKIDEVLHSEVLGKIAISVSSVF
jgi:Uma2 family endonuclease